MPKYKLQPLYAKLADVQLYIEYMFSVKLLYTV